MEAACKTLCIASLLSVTVCQVQVRRHLLTDGPPFYRPPVGYGGFNYRSAFHDYNTPSPQLNYTVHSAGHSGGHGLTAWAIVAIVLAVLAAGALLYFAALCHPVLCRRRRTHSHLQEKEQHV